MKELRRLRDQTNDPFEQELLGAWREGGPGAAGREKAWATLAPALAPAAGVVASTTTGASAHAVVVVKAGAVQAAAAVAAPAGAVMSPSVWFAASAVKWVVLASGAVAVAALVVAPGASRAPKAGGAEAPSVVAPSRAPAIAVGSALAPAHGAAAEPVATAAPTPEPKSPLAARTLTAAAPSVVLSAPASAAAASAPDDALIGRQVASLDRAREALGAGDTARALALLDEHDARFPGGALAEEAAVVRVKALLAAGRSAEAGALGRRFVEGHPSSPYAAQITRALETK